MRERKKSQGGRLPLAGLRRDELAKIHRAALILDNLRDSRSSSEPYDPELAIQYPDGVRDDQKPDVTTVLDHLLTSAQSLEFRLETVRLIDCDLHEHKAQIEGTTSGGFTFYVRVFSNTAGLINAFLELKAVFKVSTNFDLETKLAENRLILLKYDSKEPVSSMLYRFFQYLNVIENHQP